MFLKPILSKFHAPTEKYADSTKDKFFNTLGQAIKKVTFSLFHQKFENGPFLAKNGPKKRFSHFSENCALEFPNFFAGSLASAVQNILRFLFSGKFEKWPFLANIDPNLAGCWNSWKSRKPESRCF